MIVSRCIGFFVCLIAFAPNAYAYIDPGTGSIILQGILGGLAGIAYLLRLYWGKIKSLFRHEESGPQSPGNDENP